LDVISLLAEVVVVVSSLLLLALGLIMLSKPMMTESFIMGFAGSARAHYTEMGFRLLLGASLTLLSGSMRQPRLFLVLGAAIVVTSVALLIVPWRLHQRVATRVLPILVRNMRLYGLGVICFGSLVLYGALSR
jgi:hypothetical protein